MTDDRLSSTFAALADPTRRAILARLSLGETTVSDLAEPFEMSMPAVSKHLKVLERAGLIERGREAQWRPCRLDAGPLKEIDDWLERYRRFWEESFERLDQYLRDVQAKQKKKQARPKKSEAGEQAVSWKRRDKMPRLTPCLWFDDKAEEAAEFYLSVFKNSKILNVGRYTDEGKEVHGHKAGDAMIVEFELDGQRFTGLNGGPQFQFDEAISFMIDCKTQEDVDYYWEKLTADGGSESMCGWLKDKFGVSWQVVPSKVAELMNSSEPERAGRVMNALMQMKKIDIAALEKAYAG